MIVRSDIFSTPVWHENVPLPLIDELYNAAYKIKESSPKKFNRSNQGGFQTNHYNWEDFHPQGKEYIKGVLDKIFKEYSWKVSAWWYNINPEGSWNTAHSHPGNQFVLILYLTDGDELLYLMNPNNTRVYMKDINLIYNVPYVKRGEMIIFPADIIHYVKQNTKKKDRICISMNIAFL